MRVTANKTFYDSLRGEAAFMGDRLIDAEEVILSSLKDAIRGKAILEIAVGSGRVTPRLQALTDRYVGIDYSPTMIEAAKARHPDMPLFVHDAADMSIFKTGEFDAIFCFGNSIDEVERSDRLRILNEVHRLLDANGVFVFSSHNLEWKMIPSYAFPKFLPELSCQPGFFNFMLDNFFCLAAYAITSITYLFSKLTSKGQIAIWEYWHGYPKRMLVPRIYIKPEAQIRQLNLAGFQHVQAVARDGTPLTGRNCPDDFMVYYVAKKREWMASSI